MYKFQSKTYILKDGTSITTIPKGKCRFIEGSINKAGYLTLIGRVPSPKGQPKVLCQCSCGNYTVLSHQAFKNGTTKSCGCYSLKQKKELCAKIGHLSTNSKDYSLDKSNPFYCYLSPTNQQKNRSIIWNIQCRNCGTIYQEVPAQLISEKRTRGSNPCECWRNTSKGVLKIQ